MVVCSSSPKALILAVCLASTLLSNHHQSLAFSVPSSGTTTRNSACPPFSPATNLPNHFYTWKEGQQIRYQSAGPVDGEPVLLVHGLFVNSDHWRKSLKTLAEENYRVYALDLLGCGYSDKPPADSEISQRINGETWRFESPSSESILKDIPLGGGRRKRIVDVDLRHPLQSPYNFFTWSDLLTDFTKDVILNECSNKNEVSLVCNSIGTISSLQAVMDRPELYKGVFVICPNFRELHSAELPLPSLFMPILRIVQRLLRRYGQSAFDALAKPDTIKRILTQPYKRSEAVDDTLVQVLLDPLLLPGSSQVVFDTLSYSAGPLPEQQLGMFPSDKPVWVIYGEDDPWTPGPRVKALIELPPVQKVQGLPNVGHCPHDEAPELVHPLLLDFLKQLEQQQNDIQQAAAGHIHKE